MITDRRIGRFRVSVAILNEGTDTLKEFMGTVLILRAEYDFSSDTVKYMGTHKRFRELRLGDTAPEYDIIFTRAEGDEGRMETSMEFKELT